MECVCPNKPTLGHWSCGFLRWEQPLSQERKPLSAAHSMLVAVFTGLVLLSKDLTIICKWRKKKHFKVSHTWNQGLVEKANRNMAELPNSVLINRKSGCQALTTNFRFKFSLIRIFLVTATKASDKTQRIKIMFECRSWNQSEQTQRGCSHGCYNFVGHNMYFWVNHWEPDGW